jgi:hypothetical protein
MRHPNRGWEVSFWSLAIYFIRVVVSIFVIVVIFHEETTNELTETAIIVEQYTLWNGAF